MAEQTFKSPGFFDTETVKERRQNLEQTITTVPAGIAGFAKKGPAFVPVTVHSYERFVEVFGEAHQDYPSTLAAKKFLENRDALTFVRVLGAGANTTAAHFSNTETFGTVQNAGFIVTSSGDPGTGRIDYGMAQFICAEHNISNDEAVGYPIFRSNNTTLSDEANLVRGILFTTSGSKFTVIDHNDQFDPGTNNDFTGCTITTTATEDMFEKFKLVLTCSDGTLGTNNGFSGVKIFSASLNPSNDAYISKVLNTDPKRFQIDKHLLYADFPVENEIASIQGTPANSSEISIAVLSGSLQTSAKSGELYSTIFGNYKTRYRPAKTTSFISQLYGSTEYDLFHFECIDDGSFANNLFKVSISKIKKSIDPEDPYPTFDVELRVKRDTDDSPQIIESYVGCNLNPDSENFIAKKIGDMKLEYNFDTADPEERRLLVKGTYPNVSSKIRVMLSDEVINEAVPKDAAPFGFRGLPLLKTFAIEPSLEDLDIAAGKNHLRFGLPKNGSNAFKEALTGSILPPVPFRFKVTAGEGNAAPSYTGESSLKESSVKGYYWGIKFERTPRAGEFTKPLLRSNESIVYNEIVDNYSKFLGIEKIDALLTGSGADSFHHNKFSLSNVALGKFFNPTTTNIDSFAETLTQTSNEIMKDTAYIRSASLSFNDYTIAVSSTNHRVTLASLMSLTSSVYFNRFTDYAKFTNMFYGGFNGTNILDPDMAIMNDKASSADTGGKGLNAADVGLNMTFGAGDSNAVVNSYKEAVNLLTDPAQSRINLLTIPGIRSDELLSHSIERIENYAKAMIIMDVPHFDASGNRLYEDSTGLTNIRNSVEEWDSRNYDTSYAAAYFPDVVMEEGGKRINVPASVAAIAAIGFNDNTTYPWFAPAGFNRGALSFVTSTNARLNKEQRDVVYENRINPISTFPKNGYVIFGQKTLQRARTSLDRVNVRRMLLEVKRVISDAAIGFVFEANTPEVRSSFKKIVNDRLISVQENQGIDKFKVVIDSTNNTQTDIDNNVLNGKIVLVPTRAIEFISIDFIISNSGVDFV